MAAVARAVSFTTVVIIDLISCNITLRLFTYKISSVKTKLYETIKFADDGNVKIAICTMV